MTKYQDKKYFAQFNNDIAILGEEQIKEQEKKGKEFICEFCRCTLCKLVDSSGENVSYYCNRCNTSTYDTDELRSESYIEMSDGPVENPSISYTPEPQLKRKRKQYKGAFKTLQDKGIKIISYTEIRPEKEK
jgi:hypothetical protein